MTTIVDSLTKSQVRPYCATGKAAQRIVKTFKDKAQKIADEIQANTMHFPVRERFVGGDDFLKNRLYSLGTAQRRNLKRELKKAAKRAKNLYQ